MKLILQTPVVPLHINQIFGVDKTTYSRFGLAGHNGLDLRSYHGQPVYAAHNGVANYEIDNSGGHGVDILSTEKYDQGYARTRYWHLCDPKKEPQYKSPIQGKKNVKVKAGDLIGYADNTGFSTGDHLHFGLKWAEKNGTVLNYSNGFKGAVDPKPFLKETQDKWEPGAESHRIKVFQSILQDTGFFPAKTKVTEFWGPITTQSYEKFKAATGFQLSPVSPSTGGGDELPSESMINKSGLWTLGFRDFILSLVVAVGTAVLAAIADALEVGVFADIDWKGIASIAATAALGYLTKNLASDEEGRVLGEV